MESFQSLFQRWIDPVAAPVFTEDYGTHSQNPPNVQKLRHSALIPSAFDVTPFQIGNTYPVPFMTDVFPIIYRYSSIIDGWNLSHTCKLLFSTAPYMTWLNDEGKKLVEKGEDAKVVFQTCPHLRREELIFTDTVGCEYARDVLDVDFGPLTRQKIRNGEMTIWDARETVECQERILNQELTSHQLRGRPSDWINIFEEELLSPIARIIDKLLEIGNLQIPRDKYWRILEHCCKSIAMTKYVVDGSLKFTDLIPFDGKLDQVRIVLMIAEIQDQLDTNRLKMEEILNNPGKWFREFRTVKFFRDSFLRFYSSIDIAAYLGVTVEQVNRLRYEKILTAELPSLTINQLLQKPQPQFVPNPLGFGLCMEPMSNTIVNISCPSDLSRINMVWKMGATIYWLIQAYLQRLRQPGSSQLPF